jgi:hypothetical protein
MHQLASPRCATGPAAGLQHGYERYDLLLVLQSNTDTIGCLSEVVVTGNGTHWMAVVANNQLPDK